MNDKISFSFILWLYGWSKSDILQLSLRYQIMSFKLKQLQMLVFKQMVKKIKEKGKAIGHFMHGSKFRFVYSSVFDINVES